MKRSTQILAVIFVVLNLTLFTFADIKIKKTSRMNMPDMPAPVRNPRTGEMIDPSKLPDTTVLIKGPRMLTETRTEASGKKIINTRIRQCDLGREVAYTNNTKTYSVTYFNVSNNAQNDPGEFKNVAGNDGGGVVTFEITYTDTGERSQMFGYTARHIKRVIISTPSADACQTSQIKMETDGWYIDLPGFTCPTFSPPEMPDQNRRSNCSDKIEFKVKGKADNGFAVKETMTMTTTGMPSFTMTSEVTEITNTELDAMLFDIPPGYTESKESQKNSARTSAEVPGPVSGDQGNVPPNNSQPTMPGQLTDEIGIQPKKEGFIRIGIAKPKITMPDSKDDYTAKLELAGAVRDSLLELLKGEKIEAVRLSTDTPESEAKQKDCDYILYASVTQKHGGGGMFGNMIGIGAAAGSMLIPGSAGMIASSAASVLMNQTMSATVKSKDEFTFDYRVVDLLNMVLVQAVSKARAKQDGEDVLSPQITRASAKVLDAIAGKR